jgi:ABC-type transporter MlaC component
MKRLPALTAFFSLALLVAAPAAEAPSASQQQEQQVLAVVKEVQNQQVAIAENQAKIDAKLATIAEYLRVARIYSSRGGR